MLYVSKLQTEDYDKYTIVSATVDKHITGKIKFTFAISGCGEFTIHYKNMNALKEEWWSIEDLI